MHTLVLSTGSNLGNRQENLETALEQIVEKLGQIRRCSAIYESPSWGYESKNLFNNQCIELSTELDPEDCLYRIQEIELAFGRKHGETEYHDRSLDIDILFYDEAILDTELLKVPHPRIHERKFVLIPLAEILPELRHPFLHKTIRELLAECDDALEVTPVK